MVSKRSSYFSRLSSNRNLQKPVIAKSGNFVSPKYNYGQSPVKVGKKGTTGGDVDFIATQDIITPYDGAVQIQSEFNATGNEAEYEERDSLYTSFGGLSKVVSDGSIRQTTKATRNRFGVIMSTPETAVTAKPYIVPNVKHVFESRKYIEVIDISINQLRQLAKEILGPTEPPIIETVQCYPGFGTLDGTYSDGYSIQVLPELGEPSLQIAANQTIVLMSRVFSYRNETNTRIRNGLTFAWKFNADGIGKARDQVVSTGPVLRIPNAQLQQRGRYHLEVTNEKGTRTSKSYFINVLGGLLKELEPSTIGGGDGADATVVYVPTGNYIRDERHDNSVSRFDNYFDYLPNDGRWVKLKYSGNQRSGTGNWYEDTTPGSAVQSVQQAIGEEDNSVFKINGDISSGERLTKTVGGKYSQNGGSGNITFSSPGGISYTFGSDASYFDHRASRGLPQDFSGIDRG